MAASNSKYQYHFKSEPDSSLKCAICLEVASKPWQHRDCGKLFCGACLNHKESESDKFCPYCKQKQPIYMEDSKSKSITKYRAELE